MDKKRTGLVLSGGGLRGIANAGALLFLEEKNIEADILACCSAGSIVGNMYAAGKKPEEILAFFQSVYFFHWRHFSLLKGGIVSSATFRQYLEPIFGDMTIGDLPKDVRIVAAELTSGAQMVFDRNFKVNDAIIASSSIPGVATPFRIKEQVFSDGGILNNFPADVIQEECDRMIGVYVSPAQDVDASGLNTIKSVTVRAYELLSHRVESPKFDYCHWLITDNRLAQYSTFSNKKSQMDEIFEIGYEAAARSYEEGIFC